MPPFATIYVNGEPFASYRTPGKSLSPLFIPSEILQAIGEAFLGSTTVGAGISFPAGYTTTETAPGHYMTRGPVILTSAHRSQGIAYPHVETWVSRTSDLPVTWESQT